MEKTEQVGLQIKNYLLKNKHTLYLFIYLLIIGFLLSSCNQKEKTSDTHTVLQTVEVPSFNSDSAFSFVEKQVSFGPRIPNTPQHDSCAAWLIQKLNTYTDTVIVQNTTVTAYNSAVLKIQNIIASFNPENKNRILLCAHWDTRPYADQDEKDKEKPILGANDGASGVAVLLEIARVLSTADITKGIDIILFDAEDYGPPSWEYTSNKDAYCLGTQYWAKNLHTNNYYAEFGILLDMVGAPDANFCMEGTSMHFAPSIVRKVWNKAASIGYRKYFCSEQTAPITDDHLYINQITGIPTIDIIHYDPTTESRFPDYWHTHNDNLKNIDPATLKAVGQTLLYVIFDP